MNIVVIEGVLSRPPEHRTLGSGTELVACDVTVRDPGRPTDTVPVAWFDPPAASSMLAEGTEVVVVGRVRRRFFRSGGVTASRTEVVADQVVPTRQRRRAQRARAAARVVLDTPADPTDG